ncbi:geminin isoform X2 [Nilaparvata lugens]|uniref:geminin isoform X2 n=1 Tax=Nilaparvata lugens TaxID=108931 RepID=UPI00193DABE3|nr:geminin isoform X2 [Nilaparvata lugens]
MKTDVTKKAAVIDQPDKQIDNQETGMRRRTLQTLQEAAGDKENLVGGGKMPVTGKEEPKLIKKAPSPAVKLGLIEKKKQVKSVSTQQKKKVITVEDLTSQAGPSEHYWETLAERRRVALEKALEENQMLHERVALLEEENEQCKVLLEDSKAVIDTLNEILKETNSENLDSSLEDNESSIIEADERPTN